MHIVLVVFMFICVKANGQLYCVNYFLRVSASLR